MFLFVFFQSFYGILQSYVDVEPLPPVYVLCMMKYDIENVKGNMLSTLFVNIQDMLYITRHPLLRFYSRIHDGILTMYSARYGEDALDTRSVLVVNPTSASRYHSVHFLT